MDRPKYTFNSIPDPFWIAGFTSGDGSFHLNIKKFKSDDNVNHRVSLRFSINLNIRDVEILKGLVIYFNTLNQSKDKVVLNQKNRYVSKSNNTVSLAITKSSEIIEVIIPFFEKYPILGLKSLDFRDFKKVAIMIDAKKHLTIEGLNRILEIKLNMNKHRK